MSAVDHSPSGVAAENVVHANKEPAAGRRWTTPLVFAVLAALAFWGHHTGWTMPKFSALVGGASSEPLWCEEHGVPEDQCVVCNKSLLAEHADYGWCKEHGVPQCPWEHADVAELKTPPPIDPADLAEVRAALALTPRPENNSVCRTHHEVVQFASAAAAEKAGVDIAVVDRGPVTEVVKANAEVVYDQNRIAHLTGRVPGIITRVFYQVGDRVTKGDVLALVDSTDIGRAKADYLQSLAHERLTRTTVDRLRPLASTGDVPERQFREAATAQEEARIKLLSARQTLVNLGFAWKDGEFDALSIDDVARRLQLLGMPSSVQALLPEGTTSSNLFPLTSPLDGVVTHREVVDGEAIEGRTTILEVVDPSRMWLMLDVRPADAARISVGLPVRFQATDARATATSGSATPVTGKIAWISPSVEERTRTVRVRVEVPNADGKLRANTFGVAEVVLREAPQAVVVPTEAVHWEGCCNVVFVRDRNWFVDGSPKFFHVRKVRLGVKEAGRTEILAGLLPGEVIAAKGSIVLAAQLQKSKLGEGCGCAH